jgi:PhnB protein
MNPAQNTRFVQPYLYFNGRCAEALEFYRQAVGAEVEFKMLFKESPEPVQPGMLPPDWQDKIMHVSFRVGGTVLMASDGFSPAAPDFGGFSLSLTVANAAEADRVFAALAAGGQVRMPLAKTFWAPRFGMVADRFGLGWMVTVAAPA